MAELNTYTESYTDLPLTQFPASEDDWDRMSDVSASMVSLVQDYNKLYNDGRFSDAKKLLDNNEDLLRCFFNADKYNQLRDATIAMQRFLLNEVQNLIKEVAKIQLESKIIRLRTKRGRRLILQQRLMN